LLISSTHKLVKALGGFACAEMPLRNYSRTQCIYRRPSSIYIRAALRGRAYLHCTLVVAQCIVIGPVCCGRVCVCVGGGVCYHDNSKLRASILTKLGLWVKVVTISSWLNFGRPAPRDGGLRRGENALLQPATTASITLITVCGPEVLSTQHHVNLGELNWTEPARSVCVSSERFFRNNEETLTLAPSWQRLVHFSWPDASRCIMRSFRCV